MRRNASPKAQLRRELPYSFTRPLRPLLDSHNPHLRPLCVLLAGVLDRRILVRRASTLQLSATVHRRVVDLRVWAGLPRVAVDCAKIHGSQ